MNVKGDYKIAIYANQRIKADEEVFLNYNYSKQQKLKLFVQKPTTT